MSSQRYDIYIYIFIAIFDDLKFHDDLVIATSSLE